MKAHVEGHGDGLADESRTLGGRLVSNRKEEQCLDCTEMCCQVLFLKKGLSAQEKVFANSAFVSRILSQRDSVGRKHGATVVDGITEQQTVGDVDVFLTHPEDVALHHG